MSEAKLGRDVFIALAAVGWADGKLDAEEADAIVRTAIEEGLDLDAIGEIEAATKERVDIGAIDYKGMSKADRLFVYAVGAWMTRLDGVTVDEEREALDRLGEALHIPERPREHADAIAKEIAEAEHGDVLRFDLPRLRKTIADRLEASRQARLAQGDPE
jgi:uncharacterized membrane protein YebE (DUF533 family)